MSRIGEVVINSFVDSYEFQNLPDTITAAQMKADEDAQGTEVKPMFFECVRRRPNATAPRFPRTDHSRVNPQGQLSSPG